MLVVSPAAAAAIEALLSSADFPQAVGLRLARGADDVRFLLLPQPTNGHHRPA